MKRLFSNLKQARDVEKIKKKSSLKSWRSMPRTVRLLGLPLPRSLACPLRTPGLLDRNQNALPLKIKVCLPPPPSTSWIYQLQAVLQKGF